jgi:membrane protein insertase Oxa1/YidC/SpoIIIJ
MTTLMMPLMFGLFTLSFPSGLALYWVVSNIIGIIIQYFVSGGWGYLRAPAPYKPAPAQQVPAQKVLPPAQQPSKTLQKATEQSKMLKQASEEKKKGFFRR